ncbi:hypothetical protein BDQ12DRAFT_675169 [Crucibulum laeve]|uniref:Membrane anchor Opy2 N-terminal domain-containing protein n=1 Tax=Crucibulum laeve TaxID=68775 RepID=A0A5C3MFX7_9AGAR|nr:hypothetical protein BDQ12DRAFT_675169 [Crucibulum laeve]
MHHLPALLPRQDCISCPDPLPCNCAPNQECFRINRDCNTCARNQCVAKEGASDNTSSGGVSKGALAGGVIGALIFFAIAISLFIWYRRKTRLRKAFAANREVKQDVPAPAETVLNRPDPTEKPSRPPTELGTVRMYSGSSSTTIDLDPESQNSSTNPHYHSIRSMSTHSNPFDDNHSIQTTGTEGTNVIPIALVSPDQPHHAPSTRSDPSSTSSGPVRPPRTPDMNLNLDHVNVSHDNLRSGTPYALSTISGISGVSSRNSYMTNASFSSDFLNEAPMIMTPSKGAVRQVLGVVKAEVVRAPGTLSNASSIESLKPPFVGRPSVGSPLASTSFGPADVVKEVDESQEVLDPFSDEHSSTGADFGASPPPTAASFGRGRASLHPHDTMRSDLATDGSQLPWARHDDISSRPSSMYTQAGSVIDIGSATRVNVGLGNLSPPAGSNASSRAQFRTTMGRLVTPPTGSSTGTLQEQQQRALAHAQAQAQAQGLDQNRRISGSSVMSAASTRADSILESFPFVPPSPISDRPIRSPPVSPLAQQSFTAASPTSPLGQHKFTVAPPSPLSQQGFNEDSHTSGNESADSLPAPPNRRTLGLSTASQFSTASSGLGSFPFQIDSGANSEQPPPSAFNGRHRASLDTLAITSELATYPLGFDRDSVQPPKKS